MNKDLPLETLKDEILKITSLSNAMSFLNQKEYDGYISYTDILKDLNYYMISGDISNVSTDIYRSMFVAIIYEDWYLLKELKCRDYQILIDFYNFVKKTDEYIYYRRGLHLDKLIDG